MFRHPNYLGRKFLLTNIRPPKSRTSYSYTRVLNRILNDKVFQRKCKDAGLTNELLRKSFNAFKTDLVFTKDKANIKALQVQYALNGISSSKYDYTSIFPLFLEYSKANIPTLKNVNKLKKIADLSDPTEWYPETRAMRRSIIFHAGPTNSGKTHAALERFLAAGSGTYCCPLRLLAREIFTKTKQQKVQCSLVTGEERNCQGDYSHTACTVEMTNLSSCYDVAVIDEIQLIAHEERGWAWTRALLGVRANEVHVCGEPRAISLVESLAMECGDDFYLKEYERLTKLRVKKYPVGSVDKLREGDCVVCFTRNEIYNTVSKLALGGKKSAVIYGKLPPSTKREEAKKFNNSDNLHNILVATDAVGMGLNLNIKRIVFNSLDKGVRDGSGNIVSTRLTAPEVLQIAGRAGRFGLQESGEVTAMHEKDMYDLHSLLKGDKEDLTHAGILPTVHLYQKFANASSCFSVYKVMKQFHTTCRIDHSLYKLCSQADSLNLAEKLQDPKLSFVDTYKLSLCPINVENHIPLTLFMFFAQQIARKRKISYECVCKKLMSLGVKIPFLPVSQYSKLMILEDTHNALGAYLWLRYQFPAFFPGYYDVLSLRHSLENVITLSLKNIRCSSLISTQKLIYARKKRNKRR